MVRLPLMPLAERGSASARSSDGPGEPARCSSTALAAGVDRRRSGRSRPVVWPLRPSRPSLRSPTSSASPSMRYGRRSASQPGVSNPQDHLATRASAWSRRRVPSDQDTRPVVIRGSRTPRTSRRTASPAGVTSMARRAGNRRTQPASRIRVSSAAPRAPPRWWRCSLQSTQKRSSGRRFPARPARQVDAQVGEDRLGGGAQPVRMVANAGGSAIALAALGLRRGRRCGSGHQIQ